MHFIYSFTASSPKRIGTNVSDQLNTLRSLLEARLKEQDDTNHQKKDSSMLQTSPKTFAKEFLQSYQESKYGNNAIELISDLDDDEHESQKLTRNFQYYDQNKDKYYYDTLSTPIKSFNQHEYLTESRPQYTSILSDDINQTKSNLSTTLSSRSKSPVKFNKSKSIIN